MPYYDPYKYFIGPHKYYIDPTKTPDIGINYRKPYTLQDIIETKGYDDLSIWRNHLDLFEISYIVCLHSDGTVKLETDYYTANFDATNNYKFIGIE